MGWTFVRMTRDQLIRELTATEDTERSRNEVIDHTLVSNVLWSVVRITAKQAGVLGLAPGESATLIGCHLLESEGREWGYKSLTEAEHPYYYSCPLSYLDMASQRCATWRARVHAFHQQQPTRKAAGDAATPVRRTWTPSCRPCRLSYFASSKTSWPTTRFPTTTNCASTSSPTA